MPASGATLCNGVGIGFGCAFLAPSLLTLHEVVKVKAQVAGHLQGGLALCLFRLGTDRQVSADPMAMVVSVRAGFPFCRFSISFPNAWCIGLPFALGHTWKMPHRVSRSVKMAGGHVPTLLQLKPFCHSKLQIHLCFCWQNYRFVVESEPLVYYISPFSGNTVVGHSIFVDSGMRSLCNMTFSGSPNHASLVPHVPKMECASGSYSHCPTTSGGRAMAMA